VFFNTVTKSGPRGGSNPPWRVLLVLPDLFSIRRHAVVPHVPEGLEQLKNTPKPCNYEKKNLLDSPKKKEISYINRVSGESLPIDSTN